MRTTRAVLLFAGLPLIGAACDAEPTNDFLGGLDPIPPEPIKDSGAAMPDASGAVCALTPPADCSGGAAVDLCSSKAAEGTGTIKGTVTASAMPLGSYEAKGDLIIGVVPVFDTTACAGEGPAAVASTIIHCADLTDGKAVPFEILGVPPRAEAWKLVPFLDPNSNGVDGCDLLALPADASITAPGQTADGVSLRLSFNGSLLVAPPNSCGYAECK